MDPYYKLSLLGAKLKVLVGVHTFNERLKFLLQDFIHKFIISTIMYR